jgi:hypothetical protein
MKQGMKLLNSGCFVLSLRSVALSDDGDNAIAVHQVL